MTRPEKLVPIAEFDDRTVAEEAWARLAEAGIPGNVLSDPALIGGSTVVRIEVARSDVAAAQRLIADLVVPGAGS